MRTRPMPSTGPRRLSLMATTVALFLASPDAALAHSGPPPTPETLWRSWTWEPTILLGLTVTAGLYAAGTWALWSRRGTGHGVSPWRVAAFGGGLAALFVALVSPLEALGSALFAGHMAQHLLLTIVAAPLLALGAPNLPLLMALPRPWRREVGRAGRRLARVWRLLTRPEVVWGLHAGALWLWHLPVAYETALGSEPVHFLQHASFLGTALLFWWVIVHPLQRKRLHPGLAVLFLFTTALQGTWLALLLTFSEVPWYPAYSPTVAPWDVTPLQDQHLGGVIMWIPMGIVYVLSAVTLFALWLIETERNERAQQGGCESLPASAAVDDGASSAAARQR